MSISVIIKNDDSRPGAIIEVAVQSVGDAPPSLEPAIRLSGGHETTKLVHHGQRLIVTEYQSE